MIQRPLKVIWHQCMALDIFIAFPLFSSHNHCFR